MMRVRFCGVEWAAKEMDENEFGTSEAIY